MALFGFKSKKDASQKGGEEKKAPAKKVMRTTSATSTPAQKSTPLSAFKDVLMRPRVTEKAANMTSSNVYTFDVRKSATKRDIAAAITRIYKVTPIKINVVNTPAKKVAMRKKRGFGKTSASRKAYVFLKEGQEIQTS